jgi:uncharacterized protein (TIGR02246 family)
MTNGIPKQRPAPTCLAVWAAVLVLGFATACRIGEIGSTGDRPNDAANPPYPQQAAAEWDSAFNSRDVSRLVALYAQDVVSMPFNAPTVRGRPALQAEFEKFFQNNKGRHQTIVEENLVKDDWAIERARYTLSYLPTGASTMVVETGRHVMCRKRINGSWLVVWEIWNTDTP